MSKLYAENILIGSQWQADKTLSITADGTITSIEAGKDAQAMHLNGPVIPGMVNCHSHAFQRAFAGYSEYRGRTGSGVVIEDSFWSWRDIMYRFVAKMTPEDAHQVASFVYIEMLKAGYTSVAEFHYLHHQVGGTHYDDPAEMSNQIINAASSTGIGLTHLPVLYSYAGFGEVSPSDAQGRFIHSTEDYLKLIDGLNKKYTNQNNFQLGIAPHSLRAVSQSQLKEIVPYIRAINKNAPIHIHISEQMQEVNDCLKHYGQRPVEWLLDNYPMGENWCLVHATHLIDEEIKKLAESGAVVGICPLTEANLGDGIFPTAEYLKQGGKFAIGSDSHISINVAEELRLLEYGQRLSKNQRAVLVSKYSPVDESCSSVGQYLYSKATRDGAKAIGQNVGEIAVGKRADLVVLDSDHPSMFSKQQSFILDAAIFACSELPVKDVFVAGKQVVSAGCHPLDSKTIENYKSVLTRIV
jgi:formimidoylglutamate deiminase